MRTISLSKAFDKAVDDWQVDPLERFRIRFALAVRPKARRAVLSFVKEKAAADDAFEVGDRIDLERLAELIELILKYLPLILEIILPLFASDEQ